MRTSRRAFVKMTGALVVGFARAPKLTLAQDRLPGSLQGNRRLDGWIAIHPNGRVTIFTGKIELGQGIGTALAQIAADELDVELARIDVVHGDTARTPNEGQTAGSLSVEQSGTAVRFACAEARAILLEAAEARLSVAVRELTVKDGTISERTGGISRHRRSEARSEGEGEAESRERTTLGRQEHRPPRHPEEVHGRRRLRAGRPPSWDGLRTRRAAAVTGRAARVGRRSARAAHARRRGRRARWKLSRRGRRPGGAGHPRARDTQAERTGQRRHVVARAVEPSAQHAAGFDHGRESPRRPPSRPAVRPDRAGRRAAADGRRCTQRHSPLRLPEREGDQALRRRRADRTSALRTLGG